MKSWRIFLFGWLIWFGAVASSAGQGMGGWGAQRNLPDPPPFGVLDSAGFYSRNPEGMRRISDLVRALEQKRGFRIYVVVESVLVATNAADFASELQEAWLPDGRGLVVVYQTDGRVLGFGRAAGDEAERASLPGNVPSYKTLELLTEVLESMDPTDSPEVYLETLVTRIVAAYEGYFQQLDAPLPSGRGLKLALITVGALSLLGLGAMGAGWLMNRSESVQLPTFRFPPVDVRERLGAPYGGGDISSRRFGGDRGREA